jgi:serine/threonine-protein kinase
MTPEYAAPEQVRGGAITTATDVYALGALLYELLTARRPHALVDRNLQSIEKAICEDAPERPSLAVGRTVAARLDGGAHTVTPAGVSHARSTTPERLRRTLGGDLDTITLKALRKEPEQRYNSADAFAADLRRYRDGIPVQARRPTAGYRVRKFVMRHRTGVAVAAAVVAVLAAVIGFYTAQLTAERDRAQLEATKAEEVSEFLTALFTSSDPAESLGAEVTARQLLAEGTERIENELASQPEVQAQMYGTIGRVYHSLGLLEQAEATLQRSLDLYSSVGAEAADLARTQTDLGSVYVSLNNFDAADSLLQRALTVQRASDAEAGEDLAATLEEYGDLLIERGDYPDAEAPYREALEIRRALHGEEHPAYASLLSRIGVSYGRMGRYDESLETHEAALALHRQLHGDLHPATTESLRETSTSHRRLDNFVEAEALIREAIALDSQLVGLEHPNMGEDYYQYASLLSDMGRFDEATEMFERSLAVDKATLGEDHPYIAITLGDLGQLRQRAGDREGAIAYYRQGVEMARRELPSDYPQLAGLLHKLGEALSFTGQFEEAEASIREALAITRSRLDEDHVQVLSIRSALGSFYVRAGRHDEAIPLFRDVLSRRQRTQGENSAITARGYYNLSAALRVKGTPESLTEAREVIATGVDRYHSVFPSESREVGYALMEQADVFRASGDTTNAVATYREAGRIFRASLGSDHPILERVRESLAAMAEG